MMDFSGSGKYTLESISSGSVSCVWAVQTLLEHVHLWDQTEKEYIHLMESDVKMRKHENGLKLQNFTRVYKTKGRREEKKLKNVLSQTKLAVL